MKTAMNGKGQRIDALSIECYSCNRLSKSCVGKKSDKVPCLLFEKK